VVLSFVPMPFTAVIMTTAMPAAINAYSIEVAPASSLKKARNRINIGSSIGRTFTERQISVGRVERDLSCRLPKYCNENTQTANSASKDPENDFALRQVAEAAYDEEHSFE
jgi:hypothetical protein